MKTEDDDLAARAQRGDREAFRQLLERHYDAVYRVAYRLLGNMEDAEDVTQDVFLALPAKLRSYRTKSPFSTWLYAVAMNACRDHLSTETLEADVGGVIVDPVDPITGAIVPPGDPRLEFWRKALATLEPGSRETIMLVLGEGLSHAEAARVLGCAEGTVSRRMAEVRKRLKALLGSDDD